MKNKENLNWNPEKAVSYWVNNASRGILKHFEHKLRPYGFGMAYLPVALALEELGTLTQKELAHRIQVEQPTMAALLKRMERDQIIVRQKSSEDKRISHIYLTDKGKARLPEVKACLDREAQVLVRGFSQQEQQTLLQLLKKLTQNLNAL